MKFSKRARSPGFAARDWCGEIAVVARLLFLTSSFPSTPDDGICGYIADLAAELVASHGHHVRVVTPAASGPTDDRGFAPTEIVRFTYPTPGAKAFSSDRDAGAALQSSPAAKAEAVVFLGAFARAARRESALADAIVSHWLAPSGIVGAALRRPDRPHVAVAHGGDVHLLSATAYGARIARWVLGRSDRVACAASWQLSAIERLAGPKAPAADLVRMGASIGPRPDPSDVDAFRRAHSLSDTPGVLFLGRLVPIKGVDVLLDAASAAPDVAVWIAGDGPESEALRAKAAAARLRVSFLGRLGRRERRLALEACSAVVIPSIVDGNGRQEGAPVVASEALAAGRPIIATRTGELPTMLDDGRNALLVEPNDAAALARALGQIAGDAGLRSRLSAGAVSGAEEFTISRTAERIAAMIADVLDRRKHPNVTTR